MSDFAQTPYLAAYLIFRNDEGKVAFVLRENTSWMNDYYGLPSGKVEDHENVIAGAVREAKEETGVTVQANDLRHVLTLHRQDKDADWIDITFEVTAWEGELQNAEPHMHSELVWLDPKSLPDNVIPNVRYILEQVAAGNTYAEFGWASRK